MATKRKAAKKAKVARAPKDAIYYAEYFDDRCGPEVNTGWITRNDLKKIASAAKAENEGTLKDEDPDAEQLWEQLMHTDDTLYLAAEVFGWDCKNPVRTCAAILKAIEGINGHWGKFGESGSYAFGLSKKMALAKLDKLEGPSRLWRDG